LGCSLYFGYKVIKPQSSYLVTAESHTHQVTTLFFNMIDTPVAVFTTVQKLTMPSIKCTSYCVHNSPEIDHVLRQMTHISVLTTVQNLTISSAK